MNRIKTTNSLIVKFDVRKEDSKSISGERGG